MNIKLGSIRSPASAQVWFFDLLGLAVTSIGVGSIILSALLDGEWLIAALLVAFGSCWTSRLRIARDTPGELELTVFWFVIPLRRWRCRVEAITTEHADDWTAGLHDPPDVLMLGEHRFLCRHAEQVRAWLVVAATALATPHAHVKDQ